MAGVRLPTVVRASLLALLILFAGQSLPSIALIANLRAAPRLPLFLPLTIVWLWLFWRYLDGSWWPQSTAAQRRLDLRGTPLPASVWCWSLLAGGLAMASVMSLALLTGRVADLPDAAYKAPADLSAYPWWTVLAFFVAIAITAAVVEEAAFRGYMLSGIQRRHGWVAAIAITAALFYVVHLSHAYATIAFVPFFAAYSLLHGVLVFLTRSILPSIVLHALGDAIVLPMQYGVVNLPFGERYEPYLACVLLFALAAVFPFLRLMKAGPAGKRSPAIGVS